MGPDGEHARLIRRRKFPIVGGGTGVWSFVHIADAAPATADAVTRGRGDLQRRRRRAGPGRRLAARPGGDARRQAAAAGAARLGRMLARDAAAVMMTEVRGASNEKARRELGGARATRPGARVSRGRQRDRRGGCCSMVSAAGVRDRLPDARQRVRGGGCRPGGADPGPPGARLRRVDELAGCLRGDRHNPPGDRLAALGAGPPGDLCRGRWLPEPLVSEQSDDDPARHAETADSLSLAFLRRSSRACHPTSGRCSCCATSSTTPTSRSPGSSARPKPTHGSSRCRRGRHVEQRRPRFEASREARDRLAERFFAAAGDGDLADSRRYLAGDVVLDGDGGGPRAGARPVSPRARPGRADAGGLGAGRSEIGADEHRPGRRQRPARSPAARLRSAADRRDGPRHRRWRG